MFFKAKLKFSVVLFSLILAVFLVSIKTNLFGLVQSYPEVRVNYGEDLEQVEIDFGKIKTFEISSKSVGYKNLTLSEMEIVEIERSCSCVEVHPSAEKVKANEEVFFLVKIKGGSSVSDENRRIRVKLKGEKVQIFEIIVRAKVRPDLSVSENKIEFPNLVRGKSLKNTLIIENYSDTDWKIFDLRKPTIAQIEAIDAIEDGFKNDKNGPRQKWMITLSVHANEELKTNFIDSFEIINPITKEKHMISILGNVIDAFTVTPTVLNFGNVEAGKGGVGKFLIHYNGEEECSNIKDNIALKSDGGSFMIRSVEQKSQRVWEILITFKPPMTPAGDISGSFEVYFLNGDYQKMDIRFIAFLEN